MQINSRGTVSLEEGDTFIEEVVSTDGINRIATFTLANGAHVLVQRHFSTIGPEIYDPNGRKVVTHFDGRAVVRKEMSDEWYAARDRHLVRRPSRS